MKRNPKKESRFNFIRRKRWIIYLVLFVAFVIFVLAEM